MCKKGTKAVVHRCPMKKLLNFVKFAGKNLSWSL